MSALVLHPRAGDELGKIAVAGAGFREEDEVRTRDSGIGNRESETRIAITARVRRSIPDSRSPIPTSSYNDRQLRTHDPLDAQLVRRLREHDDAAEVVVVGERERGHP